MKIFKPEDFKKPNPDQLRNEIATKVEAAMSSATIDFTDKGLTVLVKITGNYDAKTLTDFNSWYARQGSWKEVTSNRKPSDNVITIAFNN